jgi:hypothetical protein
MDCMTSSDSHLVNIMLNEARKYKGSVGILQSSKFTNSHFSIEIATTFQNQFDEDDL